MPLKAQGFTLLEILIAMAVGSLLLLGAARTLPMIQTQNLRLMMQAQLHEELQQMMRTLEKAVRRAGYCNGTCRGKGLHIGRADGSCLLVRWDENSNGRWEGPGHKDSDFYGYRLRGKNLETQRGVDSCEGGGWERLNEPRLITISAFRLEMRHRLIKVTLSGFAKAWPDVSLTVEHWLMAENL
uniref:General secretion pathway protein J n=1 Tax=Erwinia amylovora ATCC BAA-2158 TaxID=889211 RepID=E5B249_ERWAM|nr:General secretion pathway protein J precursor [Erwinia amylovora ATCC BAA-2158]